MAQEKRWIAEVYDPRATHPSDSGNEETVCEDHRASTQCASLVLV